jgi:hypothetical protein
MKPYNMITKFTAALIAVFAMAGCTKLDEGLNSTLTNAQVSSSLGTAGTGLLLSAAYSDIGGPLTSQDRVILPDGKYHRRITGTNKRW